MGRNRDNSPVEHTCPKINEVISAIELVDWGENNYWTAKSVVKIMEEIREANSKLRTWGNEECRDKEIFESDIDDLKGEIEDLKSEIEDLKEELENEKCEIM